MTHLVLRVSIGGGHRLFSLFASLCLPPYSIKNKKNCPFDGIRCIGRSTRTSLNRIVSEATRPKCIMCSGVRRHEPGHPAARGRGGAGARRPARAQPHHAGRAVPAHAAVLRRVPVSCTTHKSQPFAPITAPNSFLLQYTICL